MKNKITDERIERQQQKFVAHAYIIIISILYISIIVKIFMYNNDVGTYLGELIAVLASGIYMLIRLSIAGINPLGTDKKGFSITLSAIVGAVVAATALINNWEGYQRLDSIPAAIITVFSTFASSFLITLGIMFVFTKMSKKRNEKLEEKFDE